MWEWMQGAGTLLSGISQGYGAVKQAQIGKQMLDFNKEAFNWNKKQDQRANDLQDKAQFNLDSAVSSVYGTEEKKQTNPLLNLTA